MTREELRAAGHDVGAAAYARLAEFVRLLLEENARLNLTAAKTAAEIWRGHVCDSLALAGLVSERRVQALLDLGSGGGLPGVPVACVCEGVRVTLLDATRKKVDAAARMIARLGLSNATALWGRAEVRAHAPAYRERFDAVTSRAVAELPVLLEYAAGFVRSGGECWFFKSAARAAEERAAAQAAAAMCVLEYVGALSYRLPGEADARVVLRYRKSGVLRADLPRAPGRARKRPL